jgi:endo-1,4-beta-xylanase
MSYWHSLPRETSCRRPNRRCFGRLFVLVAAVLCAAASGSAQVVSHGFESNQLHGWAPRGGTVTLTSTTEAARSGTNSLKTSGRTAGWHGPSLDLRSLLAPNATYQITGWVRLVAGQPASSLKFTVERTPSGESTSWSTVGSAVTTTDGAWVQLQGNYSFTTASNSTLLLYLESSDPTSAYHLDDFTITLVSAPSCPEPLDQTGLFADFETGTTEGWGGRGSASVAVTTDDAFSGTRSLRVTGRTASWNGAAINALCKLHKGSKYLVSLRAKLLPGAGSAQLRVSLQAGLGGATSFHTVIGNTTVTDGGWVYLSTEYTFGLDVDQLQLYVETASGTASFFIDEFLLMHVPIKPIQTDIPSVHEVLAEYFPVGAAIEPLETMGVHAELLRKHFNMIVAGNAMKWDALQPSEGVFNFTRADAIANFARAHGLRMRGHTLLWHEQTPAWVFRDTTGNPLVPGNPDHRALLLQRLEKHIHTVVPRYADIVDSWDVVNEVIDASQPGGLRNSPWLQIIGPEYIDWAFEFASEVAGAAKLCINDFNTHQPGKRAALQAVVQGLLGRGLRVDSVGHQMHINVAAPSIADIRQTLELFAGMGLINEITEMDVSCYTNSTDTSPVSPETLVRQGYRYRDVFNLYRELKDIISTVFLWGLADDNTWLKTFPIARDDKPLLFDEQLQAKHAYWGVVDPSMLPVVPKELNVTAGSIAINGASKSHMDALAPVALTSNSGGPSWASMKVLWSAQTLYALVDVLDATVSPGDRVEIFVDENNDKATSYDNNDWRFTFQGFGKQTNNGATGIITEIAGGYRLKVAIPLNRALAAGNQVGFDVRVTDSASGQRLSWSDTKHHQDSDTSRFGTLRLLAAKRILETRYGVPAIDALEDKVWKNAAEITTDRFVLGTSGATARVKTLWAEGHLYVFAIVSDPLLSKASANRWEQDSVEIFVDQSNAQTTTYQSDDAQYRVNYDNERSFGGAATAAKFTTATRVVPGGYIVEAAIAMDAAPLQAGKYIGFDFQVNNDSTGTGVRSSVATWNDTLGRAFENPSLFGALRLIPAGSP